MNQTMSVVSFVRNETTQKRINQLIGSRTPQLTTSLITAVNTNYRLAKCTPESVLNAALIAASMDLPINPNLGFAYIVPYEDKSRNIFEAQFQMGWKGFVQLAQRSGFYKTINVTDVRESELKERHRLSGEIDFEFVDDDKERQKLDVLGYVSYFRLNSGFEKTLYMSVEEIEAHALEYSKSYAYDKSKGYKKSNWSTDFDSMARKTVLKLLISKYGPMNTQLQEAITKDQAVIKDDEIVYVDNEQDLPRLSPLERTMSRHVGWINKCFKDLGYESDAEQKGFIRSVLKKDTYDTPKEAEDLTEALRIEIESKEEQ